MARRGVWQLQRLVLNYCDFGGSSRGAREFAATLLPRFREENPQLEVEAAVSRGRHPRWRAAYATGNVRSVDLRNCAPGEVLRQAALLRSAAGRLARTRAARVQARRPSVQGPWTPELQDRLLRGFPAAGGGQQLEGT